MRRTALRARCSFPSRATIQVHTAHGVVQAVRGGSKGRGRWRGAVTPPSPEDLKAQADAYARLFAIFIKHKKVVERVTFWGLSDRRTWRWLVEADTDAHGYDHNGERTSLWAFLRLTLERNAPGETDKGFEDIDLNGFGLRISGGEEK